jgi:hypothetical protein
MQDVLTNRSNLLQNSTASPLKILPDRKKSWQDIWIQRKKCYWGTYFSLCERK